MDIKLKKFFISKKAQQEMSFIMYHEPNGLLAAIFASLPLDLKQHCIKVGAIAGIIAEQVPEAFIPEGLTRQDYANAVRYGGFYHDLGVYLAQNQLTDYPTAGKKVLENEIPTRTVAAPIRQVILETVGCFGERCDGLGYPNNLTGREIPLHASICAIANTVDSVIAGGRLHRLDRTMQEIKVYIKNNINAIFLPEAVESYWKAEQQIQQLYRRWTDRPPIWKYNDLTPISRKPGETIG